MTSPRLERIAYGGWEHCLKMTNDALEVVVTLDVGPRILRFGRPGGPSVFKEFPDQLGKTSGSTWLSFGGHRLWHAPEVVPRTYAPDFDPVDHRWDVERLVLSQKIEAATGIAKEIELRIDGDRVDLLHRLTNTNVWAVELAPWCLSVMAPGGRLLVPQEAFRPHPEALSPARPVVLWHFTRMNDPRYTWGDRLIQLRQDDAQPSPTKFGVANTLGWAAYQIDEQLFVKTFEHQSRWVYPDHGCNCEFFTAPGFLEVESLGPLTRLAPGEAVEHRECWFLFGAPTLPREEQELTAALRPILERVGKRPL